MMCSVPVDVQSVVVSIDGDGDGVCFLGVDMKRSTGLEITGADKQRGHR